MFFWLLSRFARAGIPITGEGAEHEHVVDEVMTALRTLDAMSQEANPAKPARLNFMLTNGEFLVASRWNNGLHSVVRHGVHDCEICGIPHVHHDPGTEYRAVVIASEPISHEPWEEVPEYSVVSVDQNMALSVRSAQAQGRQG